MTSLNVKLFIDEGRLRRIHLRVFLCCLVSLTFEGYDLVVYGATLPLLMREWHMAPAYAGFIASFGFAAATVGAIAGGSMGGRWGRKRTIVTSVVIYSLGSFVCALARAPLWFACFRVIAGFGMGMTLQNEVGMVSEYFPAKSRQAAVAGVTTGMQLGGILSALVAIVLVERFGWTSAYFFGSLPILLVPVLIRYLPEAPWMLVLKQRWSELRQVLTELRPDVPLAPDVTFTYPKAQERPTLAEVFAEGRALSTVLFWTVYFMNIFAIYGTNTWIPKLMMNAGHSIRASLTIYLAMFAGALVASPLLGHLADRLGSKKIYHPLLSLRLCFYSASLCAHEPAAHPPHSGPRRYLHPGSAERHARLRLAVLSPGGQSHHDGLGALRRPLWRPARPPAGGILLNFHATSVRQLPGLRLPCLICALAITFVQDRFAFNAR